jgi:hypothetical protein
MNPFVRFNHRFESTDLQFTHLPNPACCRPGFIYKMEPVRKVLEGSSEMATAQSEYVQKRQHYIVGCIILNLKRVEIKATGTRSQGCNRRNIE